MPSERRSKEDTWTPEELNKALKRGDRRSHEESRRRGDRHRDEMNGEDDRRSKHRDERHRRDNSNKRVSIDEDEREKQRRERREKREGKKDDSSRHRTKEEGGRKKLIIDDDSDGDRDKKSDRDREREREERRRKRDEGKKRGGDAESSHHRNREESGKMRGFIDNDSDNDKQRKSERDREKEREERRRKREEEETKKRDDRKSGRSDADREKRRKLVVSDDDEDTGRRREKDREEERERRRRQKEEEDQRKRGHSDSKKSGKDSVRHRKPVISDEEIEVPKIRDRDREEERERRRKERERDEGDRRKHHESSRRRHEEKDSERRRHHRDREENDDDSHRRKSEKREHRNNDEDDEEERERQRRERRERREGRDKDRDRSRKEEDEEERRRRKREEREQEERERRDREREAEKLKREKSARPGTRGAGRSKPKEEEEDDYGDYEDDFEDYEEDFEEEEDESTKRSHKSKSLIQNEGGQEESLHKVKRSGTALDYSDNEMNDLLKALDKENERLLQDSRTPSARPRQRQQKYDDEDSSGPSSDQESRPQPTRSRTLINFVGAKKKVMHSVANRIMGRRATDLLQMIELDVATFDLLDMPPVGEYDLYIRSFGRSNAIQTYVQTNEDNLDKDIQTDDVDFRQKWTQHPPEDFVGCGRGDGEKDLEYEEQNIVRNTQQDMKRFSKFMQKAGQVMSILLEENTVTVERSESKSNKSHIKVSEGYTQLGSLDFLEGRYVQFAQFSLSEPNMLLTCFCPSKKADDPSPLSKTGVLCVWNTNDAAYPQRILACESRPTSCCFSPTTSSLAFAGMVDGSVCVWDLREPSSMHKSITCSDMQHVLRYPTYNTASFLELDNHHSPVTAINPIAYYTMKGEKEKREEGSGMSFQLLSIEEHGLINFWVVAELSTSDMSGSEMDLGLSPGGKVKIVKSSVINLEHPARYKRIGTSFKAFDLQLAPYDSNHYFVSTDGGYILHGLRFGNKAFPTSYTATPDVPTDVTCIDFSPFGHSCFLVCCGDGYVHLYTTKSENPLVSWPPKLWDSKSLKCVRWSRSRPCVFYVLDDNSRLYTFDILEGDTLPAQVDTIAQHRVETLVFSTPGKDSHSRKPQFLISTEDGKTEIHTISQQFRETQTLEDEFLPSFLSRF